MRIVLIFCSLLFTLASARVALAATPAPRVLMMVPDDFMWPEYRVPRDLYEKAGFDVTVAGRFEGKVRPDRRNARDFPASGPLKVDVTFDRVKLEDYDALTFVAGNGAWHDFFPDETVHRLVKGAMEREMVLGLLCASTGLLGFVDNVDGDGRPLAEGKRVVGYYRVSGILKRLGRVDYQDGDRKEPAVAVDGKLVTGRNPESSELFGKKIVELLAASGEVATDASAVSTEAARPALANGIYLVLAQRSQTDRGAPVAKGRVEVVYDYAILEESERPPPEYLILRSEPDVPLQLATKPDKRTDASGKPMLHLQLESRHAARLEKFTAKNLMRRVAVVIGGRVATAHQIKAAIVGGRIQLTRCTDRACETLYTELTR